MNARDTAGCVAWLALLAAMVLAVLLMLQSGCCVSTCETMLVECERGLEDLQQQVESMCSCALPEREDDGGCALAAAEAP